MPAGPRIRANNVYGTVSDNPLLMGSVSMTSLGLSLLPAVSSAHAILVLDPKRVFGEPEIVVVTSHLAMGTTATITRGAYGTVDRDHPQGTAWAHVPVGPDDYTAIVTSGTRPSDPYRGQDIFETDTNRLVARSTTDTWQQYGLFFDPPACRVFHNANQSLNDNTITLLAFNSERFDTDSMHDTVTNNSRITINTAGLYMVTANFAVQAGNDYSQIFGSILLNGTTRIASTSFEPDKTKVQSPEINLATVYKFAATDYVEVQAYHDNTANVSRTVNASGNYSPEFAATWIGRGN